MIIKCRAIVKGYAEGDIIYSDQPINFLAMVDDNGMIIDENHILYKQSIADKILVFPNAIGSSVGAYTIYRLKRNNKAPKGIICKEVDITTASGCAISNIPLVDKPEYRLEGIRGRAIIDNDKIIL
ncbi:MAG: DUF126 domain-containing protein [Candidatus Nitrosothermus koennekii]|nr:MAG: DUF126 domain-containing protein [Candidatus Nitrosothermus koennekii]